MKIATSIRIRERCIIMVTRPWVFIGMAELTSAVTRLPIFSRYFLQLSDGDGMVHWRCLQDALFLLQNGANPIYRLWSRPNTFRFNSIFPVRDLSLRHWFLKNLFYLSSQYWLPMKLFGYALVYLLISCTVWRGPLGVVVTFSSSRLNDLLGWVYPGTYLFEGTQKSNLFKIYSFD